MYRIVIKAWVAVVALLQMAGAQEAPSTVRVLALAPESATFALAIPAPGRLERQAMRLAGRLVNDEAILAEWRTGQLALLGALLHLPISDTLAKTTSNLGLNPDAPAGVFVDLTPLRTMAEEAVAIAEEPAPWWHRRKDGEQPGTIARVAVVAGCDSPEQFRAWAEAFAQAAGLGAPRIENEVRLYEGFAFAIAEGLAIAGNDGALVGEVLARMGQPAPVRYGTPECPPLHADEVVLLTRMDHAWNLAAPTAPMVRTHGGEWQEAANLLGQMLDAPQPLFTSADPCVTTLHLGVTETSLSARLDLAQHAAYAAYAGTSAPPGLVGYLPGQPLAFAFIGTPAPLSEYPLDALMEAISLPTVAPAEAADFLDSIQEFAAGVLLDNAGTPQFAGLLKTTSPGMVPGLLEEEGVKGTGGLLQAKYANDFLGFSTSVQLLDAMMLATNAHPGTALLDARQPPMDPRTPAAGLAVLTADAVKATLVLAGDTLPVSLRNSLAAVAGVMRELRAGKVVEGHWQRTFATLYLEDTPKP